MKRRFIATISPSHPESDPPHWLLVRGTEVLVFIDSDGERGLPSETTAISYAASFDVHHLGVLDGRSVLTAEVPHDYVAPEGHTFVGVRDLFETIDPAIYSLAGRAVQIVDWDRTHRFCGRCGTATVRLTIGWASRCPACGLTNFPRLSPAVITLVERDGKALLARNAKFTTGFYSVLAGFVEPGESLEDAVEREILEEVGIEVRDIRYFGSQPWPFPHSLMIGFTAKWASGEIVRQESEIADAGWFSPDEFPPIPGPISISRALIDDFVRRTRQL